MERLRKLRRWQIFAALSVFGAVLVNTTIVIAQDRQPISEPGGLREHNLRLMMIELQNSDAHEQGYGLVIGTLGEETYALTAGHIVTDLGTGGRVVVQGRRNAFEFQTVAGPTGRGGNKSDLALISFSATSGEQKKGYCISPPGSPQNRMDIWFYGQNLAASDKGKFVGPWPDPILKAQGSFRAKSHDSGGVVYGPGGVMGILTKVQNTGRTAYEQEIFFTDIHAALKFVADSVPSLRLPPICEPRPAFRRNPAECEVARSTECWIGAAIDAYRSHPQTAIRPKLARGLGRFGSKGDLELLVADAQDANERALLWVEAAEATNTPDRALDFARTARSLLDIGQSDGAAMELMNRIIGVFGRHDSVEEARKIIERVQRTTDSFTPIEQAKGYLRLAFYSFDTGDASIWEPLSRESVRNSLTLDKAAFDAFSTWRRDWLADASFAAAQYLSPDMVFRRLRIVEGQRKGAEELSIRAYVLENVVDRAMSRAIEAYTDRGLALRAAETMREEYLWWREGDSTFDPVYAYPLVYHALFKSGAYGAAREFILSGVILPNNQMSLEPGKRFESNVADDLLQLADYVLRNEDPPRRDIVRQKYADAIEFVSTDHAGYDVPDYALKLCEEGYPHPALIFVQEILKAHIKELIVVGVLNREIPFIPPFWFDFSRTQADPDTKSADADAQLLAVDLPLCTAKGLIDLGEFEQAQNLVNLSRHHFTSSGVGFDVQRDIALRAQFDQLDPAVQAQLLFRNLLAFAPNYFDDLDKESARESYGKFLLDIGQPEKARENLGQKIWDYYVESDPRRLFVSFLLANNPKEAWKIYKEQNLVSKYNTYKGGPEEIFTFVAALELLAHGHVTEAAAQTVQVRTENLVSDLVWAAYRSARKFSISADDFERRMLPFLQFAIENPGSVYAAIAKEYADFNDWRRVSEIYRHALESDLIERDSRFIDSILRSVVRTRIQSGAYSGISGEIEQARDASTMASMFLDAANIR